MPTTAAILILQVWGSYVLIRKIFRWLALVLLAYVAAAFMSDPDWSAVWRGTLVPTIQFNREFLSLLVAVIGTTLSAYLYTWQSNEEVEEEIAMGRQHLHQRRGATAEELRQSRWDIAMGMLFSNIIMYFIILSTASTLHVAGRTEIASAAEAAEALKPLAGEAAGVLFAVGVVAVGFLAVPIMTTGAAYDVCQAFGWKHGLHARPSEAKGFYLLIAGFTLIAMCMNFFGFNPMSSGVRGDRAGFLDTPLDVLIMRMTGNRAIMGEAVNVSWPRSPSSRRGRSVACSSPLGPQFSSTCSTAATIWSPASACSCSPVRPRRSARVRALGALGGRGGRLDRVIGRDADDRRLGRADSQRSISPARWSAGPASASRSWVRCARSRRSSRLLMLGALLGVCISSLSADLNFIYLFAVRLGWLPAAGYASIFTDPWAALRYMVLPAVSLGFNQSALIARIARSCMVEVLQQDYIRTARAKGLSQRVVAYVHGFRNALVPVVTVIGVTIAILVGGAVVTEIVFNIPGMGRP